MRVQTNEDVIMALTATADRVAQNAYAPYSEFRVGVAVLGSSGSVFTGVNIENGSLGLGVCAERIALGSAFVAGERDIRVIAISCIDVRADRPIQDRLPCGGCRQWIQELAPEAEIVISGASARFTADELLPLPFRLHSR